MSSLLSAELAATCNALGYYDAMQNKYYADANTLETVKDLVRYLRRDDASHDIRRQLGETKVVQTDLLPLLKNYWEQTDLFDVLLRLLVNLTTPALMIWNEEPPKEKAEYKMYLQVEEHLRLYKQAFADEAVWAVLSTRISKILEVDIGERGDENGIIIERILILIRNVLYVAADPDAEKRPDNDASVHDQVLWALNQSGMLDIVLYMTSSTNEQVYYMHILEILSFMFREQTASDLANAALQRSQNEKMRDEAELLAIRHRENNQKQQKVRRYNGTRHSRFGGTFVVKSLKSISDNELIYHKPLEKLEALKFNVDKSKSKTPKNRTPMQGGSGERRSAFSIRLFLKEFCVEFLNGAYNTIMYHVKDRLVRQRAQQHDESYYLWALRFFMEFNRCHKFEVKLVSETMSVQSFHFVQQQMEKFFDMISTDKKKLKLWSRRLHLALLAYRELLLTICAMDKSPDASVTDSSRVIKSNIFYVLEYRELVLTLLVTYDEIKMSLSYLRDLIETQHIFIKMLESYCGGKSGRVMVQAKNKARRKKKAATARPIPQPEFNLNNMWDEISPQLSAVLEGNLEIPSDVVPFDASSDVSIDEQKSEAMRNLQRKLRAHEFENAIGLLRAAREVWPENDSFGGANMSTEEEFLALHEIFFADLGENSPPAPVPLVVEELDEYEEYEEDDLEASMQISESDLKFEDFSKRLANPRVVRACGLALVNFDRNSALTNHCIIKLLHRIAFDCKMATMLFQVSIFMTFQRIYDAKSFPQNKELVKFATYIMRQFFIVAAKNDSVYMEALFWKSSKDAYDIEEGYGSYQQKSEAATKAWTELEEDELRRLFMEHREKELQEDVVDWIVENLISNTRSRRAVLKKLKEMYLLTDYKAKKKSVTSKAPKEWGVEEEAQLAELYEQFKDAMDPLGCIMDRLDVKRPKNRIVDKLLVMGLVQDKKELRKKRMSKKSGVRNISEQSDDNASQSSDSEDDGSSFRGGTKQSSKPTAKKSYKTKKGPGKSSDHVRVSSGDLAKMLISLADGGETDALEWIKECLSDAAEDMENDPDEEGIPIVPIMDSAVSAMERPAFLNMLRGLGLQEPANEQETYWRIPSDISINTLKSHCDVLSQAIDKTLVAPEENSPKIREYSKPYQEESSDDDLFDNLKKFTRNDTSLSPDVEIPQQRKSRSPSLGIGHDSVHQEEPTNEEVVASTSKPDFKSMIKKAAKTVSKRNIELEIVGKSKIKKRIQAAESSDEEDGVYIAPEHNEENRLSFNPKRIMDSDSDDNTQTVRNILDSDDDDSDDDISPKKGFKPMRVLSSDSEDDEGVKQTEGRDEGSKDSSEKEPMKLNDVADLEKTGAVDDNKENSYDDNVVFHTDAELKRNRSVSDSDTEKPKKKRTRVLVSDEDDD